MNIGGVELKWLGHASFLIKNHKIIYIDPFNIKENSEKADIILITHSHYDHCSVADIKNIIKEGTKIVLTADSQSKITRFETKSWYLEILKFLRFLHTILISLFILKKRVG